MHGGAPRGSWPLQRGFERYYGVLEGWTNLHQPHYLVRDNSPVDVDEYPEGYYFTDDITDQAIRYVKELRAHDADRPVLPVPGPRRGARPAAGQGVRHRPPPGPLRRRVGRRPRASASPGRRSWGSSRTDTRLPPRNHEAGHEVQAWDDHSDEEQALFARYMEVYAAMVDNVDQNLARLLDTIDALGDLENTVVIFTSDNGGTEEGGATGSRSYYKKFGGFTGMTGWNLDVDRDPELIGGPQMLVHYPRGWGMASNTPFRLYKSSTHAGGVRVPMVVSWPAGIPADDRGDPARPVPVRHRPLPHDPRPGRAPGPRRPGRRPASPPPSPRAASGSTHLEQYSECFGNRSFYRDGWKLVALHRAWRALRRRRVGAVRHQRPTRPRWSTWPPSRPDKVRELAEAWEAAAWDNQVFPLDDGTGLLQLLRRPDDEAFHRPVRLLPGHPDPRALPVAAADRLPGLRHRHRARARARRRRGARRPRRPGRRLLGLRRGRRAALRVQPLRRHGRCSTAGALPPGRTPVSLRAAAGAGFTWDFELCVDDAVVASMPGAQMLLGFAPVPGHRRGHRPSLPGLVERVRAPRRRSGTRVGWSPSPTGPERRPPTTRRTWSRRSGPPAAPASSGAGAAPGPDGRDAGPSAGGHRLRTVRPWI